MPVRLAVTNISTGYCSRKARSACRLLLRCYAGVSDPSPCQNRIGNHLLPMAAGMHPRARRSHRNFGERRGLFDALGDDKQAAVGPNIATEPRKPVTKRVYKRYSSPQSPISVIRSRDFASTASIILRSSASSLMPNTRALSATCCATPSRAPTITPATAGRSST